MPSGVRKSDLGCARVTQIPWLLLDAFRTAPRWGFSAGVPDGPWNCETGEKQVAMIAQKVVDANQSKEQRRGFVALPDARTTTLRALLQNHD